MSGSYICSCRNRTDQLQLVVGLLKLECSRKTLLVLTLTLPAVVESNISFGYREHLNSNSSNLIRSNMQSRSKNVLLDVKTTKHLPDHTCHVLILTPFIVFCITTSLTVMFETQAFVLSFPRLPMLIPCPGPQFMLCTYTLVHPVCMETQSSPVRNQKSLSVSIFSMY